jgi:hypothetical protein
VSYSEEMKNAYKTVVTKMPREETTWRLRRSEENIKIV